MMLTCRQVWKLMSAFLVLVGVMIIPQSGQAQDGMNYQAVARDGSGNVMANKSIDVRFTVKDASSNQVYQEVHNGVSTNDYGLFSLVVGSQNPSGFNSVTWSDGDHELEVEVDDGSGFTIMGTQALQNVPYSLHADMEMGELNNVSTGNVSDGQVLKWSSANNEWQVASDNTGGGGGTVSTTNRLTGDGSSNSPLDIAQQGASSGQVLKWNGSEWAPATDNTGGSGGVNTDATIAGDGANTPLSIAPQNASQGEVLKWNGSSWAPATDAGGTSYTAGTGINITGSNTIENTGDTNPSDDITSGDAAGGDLSGTYPNPDVAALQGNSVSSSSPSSGQVLKWNGSSWAPGSDNTGGSGGVNTDATITGDGTSGNALGVAQQGASSGQVLQWNGSSWVPANVTTGGDNDWTIGSGNVYNTSDNIGIGTSSPSELLDIGGVAVADSGWAVNDPNDALLHFSNEPTYGQAPGTDINAGDQSLILEYGDSEGAGLYMDGDVASLWSPGDRGSDVFRIYDEDNMGSSSASPRFVVEGGSSSNVGIGTEDPSDELDVAGSINLTGALSVSGNTGSSGQVLTSTGTGLQWQSPSGGSSVWSTSGSDAYYNSGNVGINTSSPSSNLQIVMTGTGITDGIRMTSSSGNGEDWYNYMDSNDNLIVRDDGSDVMTFENNSDNVGIGTTSPAQNLHIKETGSSSDAIAALDAASGQSSTLEFRTGGSFKGSVGYSDQSGQEYVYLYEGSNALIAKNGEVNIGSNNDPNNALSVDGSANVTDNVGIGTTSPDNPLVVNQGNNTEAVLRNTSGSTKIGYRLSQQSGFFFAGMTLNPSNNRVDIYNNNSGGPITLSTGVGDERVRVTNDGNVGIGTTSPSNDLEVRDVNGDGTIAVNLLDGTGDSVNLGSVEAIKDGGGNELLIRNAALIPGSDNDEDLGSSSRRWNDVYAANGVTTTSDRRSKKEIESLDYGLNELMELNPVTYKMKNNHHPVKEKSLGLVAQEANSVIEEVVKTHDWTKKEEGGEWVYEELDRYGINYGEIVPVLINSVQEQQQIINKLQDKADQVDDLKKRVRKLEKMVKE